MIKYLGSKRVLLPAIVDAVTRPHPRGPVCSVLDLFSGTSRVGHALKRAGLRVIANDHTAYAHTLATCYVQADHERTARDAERLLAELARLPGRAGFFTETYCERSRYLHPRNGERVDAIRDEIERLGVEQELRAVLLTALIEAADRVDSTVGLQMAFLKSWAPRALRPLELRMPELLPRAGAGPGAAHALDAREAAGAFEADVAYLDPPYNQHAFLANYHVWETLARWDRPGVYGTACKREDCRTRRSDFNSRVRCGAALRDVVSRLRVRRLVVSFSADGFLGATELGAILATRGPVRVEAHEHPRYVGARIGIYNPRGERVGTPGRLRTTEYVYTVEVESPPANAEDGPRTRRPGAIPPAPTTAR